MSAALFGRQSDWVARHPDTILILLHLPFIGFTATAASTGFALFQASGGVVVVAVVLAAGAIQLRHSLAAARGARPRYWALSLPLLIGLAYIPLPIYGATWVTMQWYVLASLAMLVPRRLALGATAVMTVANGAAWFATFYPAEPPGLPVAVWLFAFPMVLLLMGGGSLYGAARLAGLVRQLRDARAELAGLAVGRERLRISRDVHDLMGQTLSAVALKGDLALRFLQRDEYPRADAEIKGLTDLAREALRDLLDVSNRVRPMSLTSEVEGGTALLTAAGIAVDVEVVAADLSAAAMELLAWAVREGITNVLRHSAATTCSIRLTREGGIVRLRVENDGAEPPSEGGHGLAGLGARAEALSGQVVASHLRDGRFQLLIEVAEDAA